MNTIFGYLSALLGIACAIGAVFGAPAVVLVILACACLIAIGVEVTTRPTTEGEQ